MPTDRPTECTGKRQSTRSSIGRGRVEQNRPSTSNNMNSRKGNEKIRSGSQSLGDEMYDNSFYVTGKVHGVVINFLVDTGATTTLMSEETFRKISENTPIMLEPTDRTCLGVNGLVVEFKGKLSTSITLGNVGRQQEIMVADIATDAAILGADFIWRNKCEINLGRQTLKIDGEVIPLWTRDNREVICRVEVKETMKIPANSKKMIPVKICKSGQIGDMGLIEPRENLFQHKQILAARGITQTKIPNPYIQVVNCGDTEVSLPKGFTMGHCEAISLEDIHAQSSCQSEDQQVKDGETPAKVISNHNSHNNVRTVS